MSTDDEEIEDEEIVLNNVHLSEGDLFIVRRKELLALVRELWPRLSDDERLKVMEECCTYCGTTTLPCYCAPGYDV